MNYYLKYLKYKQKYLDLKNLDLIGGLSLNNYTDLEGGVFGILSDVEEYKNQVQDLTLESIADKWRTKINSTSYSKNVKQIYDENTGELIGEKKLQPGYYLMFYDSNGDYYDASDDETINSHNPKFYDNHIHLLKTKVDKFGNNSIEFNITINPTDTIEGRKKIKIKQELLTQALSLNKYCEENNIKGYDKLRMFIFLLKMNEEYDLKDFIVIGDYKITYSPSENTHLYSHNNGDILPVFSDEDKEKCIQELDTYAIICTALKIINKTMTGETTGETTVTDRMNSTHFLIYLMYRANYRLLSDSEQSWYIREMTKNYLLFSEFYNMEAAKKELDDIKEKIEMINNKLIKQTTQMRSIRNNVKLNLESQEQYYEIIKKTRDFYEEKKKELTENLEKKELEYKEKYNIETIREIILENTTDSKKDDLLADFDEYEKREESRKTLIKQSKFISPQYLERERERQRKRERDREGSSRFSGNPAFDPVIERGRGRGREPRDGSSGSRIEREGRSRDRTSYYSGPGPSRDSGPRSGSGYGPSSGPRSGSGYGPSSSRERR
jgi:hypothetical protein